MNTIVIFTMNECIHCNSLKLRLEEDNIPYQEVEIGSNRAIWDQVVAQTGHNLLPTVFIRNDIDESGLVYVPGRDYQSQDEIVDIIKSHL